MHKLVELARMFFVLGCIAFGGPAAHIAMMEEWVVRKKKWVSAGTFLDWLGATNLIPGPNSTEMVMHCGYHRAGLPGMLTAGLAFILPAAFSTGLLAYLYVSYGTRPAAVSWLAGIKPAVIAVILGAVYQLGKKSLKGPYLWLIGAAACVLVLIGMSEILVILGLGALSLAGAFAMGIKAGGNENDKNSAGGGGHTSQWFPALLLTLQVPSWKLLTVFLKIGSILFGSGYVLVAYLEGELVHRLGWLTQDQLLDAIAIGQFTPGPVLTTATFVGYQLQGMTGAVLATVGIFFPAFCFVALTHPLIAKVRQSRLLAYFLDGVNVAALGVMVAVACQISIAVITGWQAGLILGISLLLTFGPWKVPTYLVIGLGALLGAFLYGSDLFS